MDSYLIDDKVEILAFDIGTKHMAYAAVYKDNDPKFDLFDITANNVICRITKLNNTLKTLPLPKQVVIEKQVGSNEVAMGIMNAISMYYIQNNIPVELYDPKKKFKYQGFKNFKGKEHKQLSISYARNIIEKICPGKLGLFESYKKKDDIADSLCMALFTYIENTNQNSKDKILTLIK